MQCADALDGSTFYWQLLMCHLPESLFWCAVYWGPKLIIPFPSVSPTSKDGGYFILIKVGIRKQSAATAIITYPEQHPDESNANPSSNFGFGTCTWIVRNRCVYKRCANSHRNCNPGHSDDGDSSFYPVGRHNRWKAFTTTERMRKTAQLAVLD